MVATDPAGKRVLVTASRGIGEAIARAFGAAGATVQTDMLVASEAGYGPFHRGFQRLRRTQLVPDTPASKLAAAVVEGVRRGRRVVYLPKRAAPLVVLVETPRRIVELALTGVPTRRT